MKHSLMKKLAIAAAMLLVTGGTVWAFHGRNAEEPAKQSEVAITTAKQEAKKQYVAAGEVQGVETIVEEEVTTPTDTQSAATQPTVTSSTAAQVKNDVTVTESVVEMTTIDTIEEFIKMPISFTAVYSSINSRNSEKSYNRIICSVDELKRICGEKHYSEKMFQKYDEVYFKERAILICMITENSSVYFSRIDSVEKQGETLILNKTRFSKPGMALQVLTSQDIILEMKKEDINCITDVKFVSNDVKISSIEDLERILKTLNKGE